MTGKRRVSSFILFLLSLVCLEAGGAFAAPVSFSSDAEPVDFSAEKLMHDEETQVITASGNVELVQGDRIIRADRIIYNLRTDKVVARGNIVLNDSSGDVHFADELVLNNNMQDGFVKGLRTLLADGSRFTAVSGQRTGGTVIVMQEASYTSCEVCENDPDFVPVWQIKANEVTYNEDEHRISYDNAYFEMFGVPIAWIPFFSHPDGTVKQKSGFLTPRFGYDSELGILVENNYYWAISPDRDATFGVMAMSQENPVLLGNYRQRWSDASINFRGSVTNSSRKDSVGGQEVVQDNEFRGHFSGDGLWDINERWRAGFGVDLASDDQYMRQYNFSSEDVLENELYVERFSGRNYAVGRLLAFQDVRVREEKIEDQPNVLPEIEMSFYGEPDQIIGGRWHVETSVLGLSRQGDGQDVARAVLMADWERRFISDSGIVTTVNASGRGDIYNTSDPDTSVYVFSDANDSETETRSFAQLHTVAAYPLAKSLENSQLYVEPKVALTIAPKLDDDFDIPNEDSQDAQIDADNLFQANRFSGFDRIEDGVRATYGMKTGLYGYEGSRADLFVGQSFRIDDDSNPFPEGSGLSNSSSDIVGQFSARYKEDYGADYRFQIGSEHLSSQRHEAEAYASWRPLYIMARYFYTSALEGTDIDTSREQAQGWVSYKLTDNWRVHGTTLHDLGEDQGLRKAEFGLDYSGQCAGFSGTYSRELTSDSSGDSGTEIMFRVSLKNLGEISASSSLDSISDDDNDDGNSD